MAIERLVM